MKLESSIAFPFFFLMMFACQWAVRTIFFCYCKAAAKEATGQATQLIAAARSAGPSNRNQASQQQLSDQCKVSSIIPLTGAMHLFYNIRSKNVVVHQDYKYVLSLVVPVCFWWNWYCARKMKISKSKKIGSRIVKKKSILALFFAIKTCAHIFQFGECYIW